WKTGLRRDWAIRSMSQQPYSAIPGGRRSSRLAVDAVSCSTGSRHTTPVTGGCMRSRVCGWFIVLLACGLMSGCEPVHSLFPLYKAEESVLDQRLIGTWRNAKPESEEDKAGRWYFSESGEKKSYDFKWGTVDARGGVLAKARLVRLGDVMFVDFE